MAATQRQRQRTEVVRIYNKGRQTLPIQVRPPQGDFYLHEQQVHLHPGKSVLLPKDHLRMEQVTNLSARGVLKVTYDSETAAAGQK